jgi:peptidyl-prolyl cis-trans isomerase C
MGETTKGNSDIVKRLQRSKPMKKSSFLFSLLPAFAILSLLLACKGGGKTLATVGKGKITENEFQEFVKTLPEPFQLRAKTPQGKKYILEHMINRMVVRLEAEQRGIPDRPEVKKKVQDALERIYTEELIQEWSKNRQISEDDLKKYYEQNKSRFVAPAQNHIQAILVRIPTNPQTGKVEEKGEKEARKKAEKALQEIRRGVPFEEVAKKYSEDTPTAQRGGDLGYLQEGSLHPELEKIIQTLKVGEVSPVTKTPFGFYIIKLVDRKPSQEKPFEEVKDQLRQEVSLRTRQEGFQNFLQEIKQKHKVKIYEENLEISSPPTSPAP